MIKNVLVVDDNQEMLLSLKEGLEKYGETFSVVLAGDGMVAVEKLKEHTISLVVTDLKMPQMDGFSLLAHLMEYFPDIPVIIITAYSTPYMEWLAREGGVVGYIEKPFMIEDLARKIITTLIKESDGGTLHGVSSGMFLQLIEMEQKTCTIRLVETESGKQGVLLFKNGELLDARSNGLQGESAAYEIFAWDETAISIQNSCSSTKKKIEKDLQAILLEAMRLKDEAVQKKASNRQERDEKIAEKTPEKNTDLYSIRSRLENELGERWGLEDMYHDSSWDNLMAQMTKIGSFFDAGELKACYIDSGESNDFILIPGEKTSVISVNPKCPKERIMQVLTG